jgi:hypothetical protein
MASSGMLRRVALVRTDVSKALSASVIRVTRICELGTLAVIGNRSTLVRFFNTLNALEILVNLIYLLCITAAAIL